MLDHIQDGVRLQFGPTDPPAVPDWLVSLTLVVSLPVAVAWLGTTGVGWAGGVASWTPGHVGFSALCASTVLFSLGLVAWIGAGPSRPQCLEVQRGWLRYRDGWRTVRVPLRDVVAFDVAPGWLGIELVSNARVAVPAPPDPESLLGFLDHLGGHHRLARAVAKERPPALLEQVRLAARADLASLRTRVERSGIACGAVAEPPASVLPNPAPAPAPALADPTLSPCLPDRIRGRRTG